MQTILSGDGALAVAPISLRASCCVIVMAMALGAAALNGPPTDEERRDEMHLWLDEQPDQTWQVVGQYPTVPGTEHGFVFQGDAASGGYNHHARIVHHGGRFHALWSNQRYDEDGPGQRVLYASSSDGLNWSRPRELVGAVSPEGPWELGGVACAAEAFVIFDGRLFGVASAFEFVAWENMEKTKRVEKATRECCHPVSRGNGKLYREIRPDGTFGRLFMSDGFILPEHPLLAIAARKDVEPSFALPAREWNEHAAVRQKPERRLCEPVVWKKGDDGFVMLLRDDSNSYRKWVSFSKDGLDWTKPRLTDIGDARSHGCAVTLKDGLVLLIINPRGKGYKDPKLGWRDRDPLTVSVSRDGLHFGNTHTVREGYYKYVVPQSGGPRCRGGSAAYPQAVVVGDFLYVIYSRGKESIETTRIPLNGLL